VEMEKCVRQAFVSALPHFVNVMESVSMFAVTRAIVANVKSLVKRANFVHVWLANARQIC